MSRKSLLALLKAKPETVDLLDYWREIFLHHDELTQKELRRVWYNCFRSWLSFPPRDHASFDTVRTLGDGASFPVRRGALTQTDPLLIDNGAVRERYCRTKKPGWKFLRCIEGRNVRPLKVPDMLEAALRADSPEAFWMALDMTGMNLSFSLFMRILSVPGKGDGVSAIVESLLRERKTLEKVMSLDELCAYFTARFRDASAVKYLEAVEKCYPGRLKNWRDPFGRNLLWYAVHNGGTCWFHPGLTLVPYLLEKGCDPDNVNTVGLSWRSLTTGMTASQMRWEMRWKRHFLPPRSKLTKAQIEEWLNQYPKGGR